MNQTLFQSDIITGVSWIKRQFLQDLQGRNEVVCLILWLSNLFKWLHKL